MTQSRPTDSTETETSTRRRVIGFFMFPLALFPLLALYTYNWRNIPELCIPAETPTSNLVGAAGDWFAYNGYQLLGLGIWSVPVVCVYAGLRLVLGKSFHPGRRTLGVMLLILATTCLLQVAGNSPDIATMLRLRTPPGLNPSVAPATGVMENLNIVPNAGGAVGYLVMTRFLAYHLAPFGASVLMFILAIVALLIIVGPRNIVSALARLTDWAADRHNDTMGNFDDSEAATEAAAAARDAAQAERIAEKQRIADEKALKEAERRAREAEREQRRREKEAEREQRRKEKEAERAAKEAERAAKEAERAAKEAEREAQRKKEEEERAALRARLQAERVPPPAAGPVDYMPPRETPSSGATDYLRPRETPSARPAGTPAVVPMRTVAPAPAPAPAPVAVSVNAAADGKEDKGPYIIPAVTLLNPVPKSNGGPGENVAAMAQRLIDTLKVFDVNAELAYYVAGPVVTQYALTLDLGTRVEKVAGLARNLQMALQATSLRIEAPIPGKNAVGIEVPNLKPASVHFREIIDGELWQKNSPGKFQVPLLLGKDAAGNDLVVDLAKLPHMLVAGATGQGKSVCLNSIINGLLMCRTPEQLRFIMVDPKRVEFTTYNRLPHLLVPIINDTNKVVFALRAALVEMEKRLKMFARAGCRNIVDFNTRKTVSQPDMFGGEEQLGDKDMPRTIPYIVIIIDEVADIMQAAGKEVEPVIARLTALARATGIHLILATQRPDTKVITGTIKSNIPGRIAFKTSSAIDSRTILDAQGSEQLIGKGDMLFKMADGRLLRAQGAYISDEEINKIIDFIGEHSNPDFDETLTRRMEKIKEADPAESLNDDEEPSEPAPAEAMATAVVGGVPPPAGMTASKEEGLFRRALEVVRDTKRASISHLQRRMGIGYNHAARIMDLLEERGVIGPAVRGSGPREILIDPETLLNGDAGAPADSSGAPDAAFSLPPDPSEEDASTI